MIDNCTDFPPDIVRKISLDIPFNDLGKFCSSSERCNQLVCNNNKYWKLRFEKDFGFEPDGEGYIDWKPYYEFYGNKIRIDQINSMLNYSFDELQDIFEQLVIDYINYNSAYDYFKLRSFSNAYSYLKDNIIHKF